MAYAHVQSPANGAVNTSATSLNLAFGSNVTAGNLIVVGGRIGANDGRTVTITDSLSNSYGAVDVQKNHSTDAQAVAIGSAENVTGGADTVTWAISGGAISIRYSCSEFSGGATSSSLDQTASGEGTSNTLATSAVTPSANGYLLYVSGGNGLVGTMTAGTDFTLSSEMPAAPLTRAANEYYIQPTAASHTGEITTSTSSAWTVVMAVFKVATGGSAIKTIDGLAKASVKTVNGLAIASVKTWNGLA